MPAPHGHRKPTKAGQLIVRRNGGLDYRELEEHADKLFADGRQVGEVRPDLGKNHLGEDVPSEHLHLSPEGARLLAVSNRHGVHRCACGAAFVANGAGAFRGWRRCLACRHEKALERLAARTAERSARRAEARADRACARCGDPVEFTRASGRFCSNKCRQAAYRGRKAANLVSGKYSGERAPGPPRVIVTPSESSRPTPAAPVGFDDPTVW